MKGVIFSELIRWVEEEFSPEIADAMILSSHTEREGVYTSVGNYPHQDAISLLVALQELAGKEVPILAKQYGYWLAPRFATLYPEIFRGYTDLRTFLRDIDAHHHMEMKKLYPDAKTPSVVALIDGEEIAISYASHRPFAHVAHGLIEGYAKYFDQSVSVERDDDDKSGNFARFVVRAAGAEQ